MIDPVFTELKLPLGAYQHVVVQAPGSATQELFAPNYEKPFYWVEMSAAMREPFKTESTLMLLDREALRRLQMLCALLKNAHNTPLVYETTLGNIPYFEMEK